MRIFEITELDEYNVIGSAVHLTEIPEKYRKYPVIGRGATSIVLDYDEHHVLMFTKDDIKREWLTSGIGLADVVDLYKSSSHPIQKMRDKFIHVLKVTKLFKLDIENKRKIRRIMKEFKEISNKHINSRFRKMDIINTYQQLFDDYNLEFNDSHDMEEFIMFISDYNTNQYEFDLSQRNFMQTKEGELVLLDPVADKEIIDTYMDIRRNSRY